MKKYLNNKPEAFNKLMDEVLEYIQFENRAITESYLKLDFLIEEDEEIETIFIKNTSASGPKIVLNDATVNKVIDAIDQALREGFQQIVIESIEGETAEVQKETNIEEPERVCSSCGQKEHDNVVLVRIPNGHICNDCLSVAQEICNEKLAEKKQEVDEEALKLAEFYRNRTLINDQVHRFKANRMTVSELKKMHETNFKLTYGTVSKSKSKKIQKAG